jgi:hypothetical protein
MTRPGSIRPVVGIVFAALLLTVAPWGQGRALAATGTLATQTLSMTVPDSGALTVSAETSTVSWTYPNAIDLGKLDFSNTLNNTTGWSVSAAMTDLLPSGFSGSCSSSSTNCLSYTNVQLTTSSIFNTISGAAPTNLFRVNSVAPFAGSDGTPGTTMSTPKQVLVAGGTDKGSYSQGDGTPGGDNNLQPTSGLSLESGTYSGTLQYTITG